MCCIDDTHILLHEANMPQAQSQSEEFILFTIESDDCVHDIVRGLCTIYYTIRGMCTLYSQRAVYTVLYSQSALYTKKSNGCVHCTVRERCTMYSQRAVYTV